MSKFFARIPNGPAGDAVHRVVNYIQHAGIACDRPASIKDDHLLIGFDGHHTNELILAMLAGLADPADAEAAQADVWRLTRLIELVPALDTRQQGALATFARSQERPTLYEAICCLIESEGLHAYFEHEDRHHENPKYQHYCIRPTGYAAYEREVDNSDTAPEWDVFSALRQKAQAERMDSGRRVALITILSLYNRKMTSDHFKGRGWTLRAGALGSYLRDRIQSAPMTFDAFVHALAVYPGW